MRDYVCRLLADRYDVLTAPDGLTPLSTAQEQCPDLVLTDIMMPRLDGFGLLSRFWDLLEMAPLPAQKAGEARA